MATNQELTDQEEGIIYSAIDDFQKSGTTIIACPFCKGKLKYIGNRSSFGISCENCGVIYSLRGI